MSSKKQDFQEVQQALRLKRHEQPPQRFFRSFSDQVIDGINSPRPGPPPPWYERLGFGDDWKPVALCVLAAVVCVVVAVGLWISQDVSPPEPSVSGPAPDPALGSFPDASHAASQTPPGYQPLAGSNGLVGITTPVMAPSGMATNLGPVPDTPKP